MKTLESTTHVAMPSSTGIIEVYKKEKSKIIDTHITDNGVEEVVYTADNAPKVLIPILKAFDETPVMKLARKTGDEYHLDYETAGEYKRQRWIGIKKRKNVEAILTDYGFDHAQLMAIFSACDRVEHEYMKQVV